MIYFELLYQEKTRFFANIYVLCRNCSSNYPIDFDFRFSWKFKGASLLLEKGLIEHGCKSFPRLAITNMDK